MPSLKNFFSELKARNVRKTLAIYMSTGLTAIGILRLFMDAYNLPRTLFPVLLTLLTCGLVSAVIFAWYHGKEGKQKFTKKEIVFHTLIAAIALTISLRVGKARLGNPIVPRERTVAVLPFKNFSDSKEDEYFSDGMTEDILTQLSKIRDLNVISRTSTMKYKETTETIPEIGRALGAGAILEGSVRRSGNRVRIVGQLIDATTDEHLWAETYDREMKDIFAIQSEVARHIAEALAARMSPEEEQRIQTPPTTNLDAYALYLQGRDFYYRYRKEDNDRAIDYFKKALALDRQYALAYAGLADAYCQRVQKFEYPRTWLDSAITASRKALDINPALAEAHKALGLAYDALGQEQLALAEYTTAVQYNPNYADVISNLANIYERRGELDKALVWLKKSLSLAPTRLFTWVSAGIVYQTLALDSAALESYHKALALDPKQQFILMQIGWLHLTRGELAAAKAIRDTILAHTPDSRLVLDYLAEVETFSGNHAKAGAYYDTMYTHGIEESRYQLAYALLKLGKRDRAIRLLEAERAQLSGEEESSDRYLHLRAAYVFGMLGNMETADAALRKAIANGLRDYRWLQADPRLEFLRPDPGFQAIMADLKARVNTMRARVLNEGIMF